MIAPGLVADCLRPFLGSAFLQQQAALCQRLGLMLYGFVPQRDSLVTLSQQLDNALFMQVREATAGRLSLVMDDERLIRLRMNDFALMADELLYLLFQHLPVNTYHQMLIREYSMRSGSLSALRALHLLYARLQSPEENQTIHRVITSCHEPWRFRHWLDSEADAPKEA